LNEIRRMEILNGSIENNGFKVNLSPDKFILHPFSKNDKITTRDTILMTTLRIQLEYYLNPENLRDDWYLRSLFKEGVNGSICVPIVNLKIFHKIQTIIWSYYKCEFEEKRILELIRDAAFCSSLLELIILRGQNSFMNVNDVDPLLLGISPNFQLLNTPSWFNNLGNVVRGYRTIEASDTSSTIEYHTIDTSDVPSTSQYHTDERVNNSHFSRRNSHSNRSRVPNDPQKKQPEYTVTIRTWYNPRKRHDKLNNSQKDTDSNEISKKESRNPKNYKDDDSKCESLIHKNIPVNRGKYKSLKSNKNRNHHFDKNNNHCHHSQDDCNDSRDFKSKPLRKQFKTHKPSFYHNNQGKENPSSFKNAPKKVQRRLQHDDHPPPKQETETNNQNKEQHGKGYKNKTQKNHSKKSDLRSKSSECSHKYIVFLKRDKFDPTFLIC